MNYICEKCGREVPVGRDCPHHIKKEDALWIAFGFGLLAFVLYFSLRS